MANITDKFGRASVPTDTAVATTVKTLRTAGVLVLEAYDLSKYSIDTPVFFVTYKKTTDPTTGIVTITNLVSWKALVNPGANTLTNLTVQPGYIDTGNAVGDFIECIPTSAWENSLIDGLFVGHNPDGTFKKSALVSALGNDGLLTQFMDESFADYIQSGGAWSLVSGLNGAMTALVAYIDGYRNTVAAIATRSFTVSKDTYIDILRNTTTNAFSIVYTEVANGAASPALAANSVRLAMVATNGTTLLYVVSSGFDSLGNRIRPSSAVTGDQAATLWYEEIGRATLLSQAASLSVINIPARKFLRIIQSTIGVGTTGEYFRFNNDSSASYDYRRAIGASASSINTGMTALDTYGDPNSQSWGTFEVLNPSVGAQNKVIHGKRTVGYPNGGSGVQYVDISAVWRNTNPINRVDYFSGAAFAAGSEVIILGHN